MNFRAKNSLSNVGIIMAMVALIMGFHIAESYADAVHRPRVFRAAYAVHWPDKPEEVTAWVLMFCSASTMLANLVDKSIRGYWKLREDNPCNPRRRRRTTRRDEDATP